MNKKEKVEAFLKELTELSEKYDFEITAEGNPNLIYDIKNQKYVCEFHLSMFKDKYIPDYN